MSKRETVLCDVEESHYGNNIVACSQLAIKICALCTRDICAQHAIHPQGGLILRVDTITPPSNGMTTDGIWQGDGAGPVPPYPQAGIPRSAIRLFICRGCRRALNDDQIVEALDALQELFVKALAAVIAAKALTK